MSRDSLSFEGLIGSLRVKRCIPGESWASQVKSTNSSSISKHFTAAGFIGAVLFFWLSGKVNWHVPCLTMAAQLVMRVLIQSLTDPLVYMSCAMPSDPLWVCISGSFWEDGLQSFMEVVPMEQLIFQSFLKILPNSSTFLWFFCCLFHFLLLILTIFLVNIIFSCFLTIDRNVSNPHANFWQFPLKLLFLQNHELKWNRVRKWKENLRIYLWIS